VHIPATPGYGIERCRDSLGYTEKEEYNDEYRLSGAHGICISDPHDPLYVLSGSGFSGYGPIWCTRNIRRDTCAAFEPCIQVPCLIAK